MIVEAVQSVLDQTYRPIEVVLVDDGSTDDTPQVLADLAAAHPEVVVLHQENAGPGAARSRGLEVARGEFVQYLDSDDLLLPEKFAVQVAALRERPEADICYGVSLRNRKGGWKPWARTAAEISAIFPDFLPRRQWDTTTPLWRRSIYDRMAADPRLGDSPPWSGFRLMEDWEHDIRVGLLGAKIVRVRDDVTVVRDEAEERASGVLSGLTPEKLRDYAGTHVAIWAIMKRFEATDASYVQPLSRTMFWLARSCGQAGLDAEADAALAVADEMAGYGDPDWSDRLSRRVVRSLRRVIGWPQTVALSERARQIGQSLPFGNRAAASE